jgi:hypothetical protein
MELESEPRSSRVNEYKDGMLDDPDRAAEIAKFQCLVNDDYEDVVAYNDIVDYIEQDDSWDGWKFKEILGHKRVQPSDPDYMGSMYNTQLLWKPVKSVGNHYTRRQDRRVQHRPVTVAIYAEKHGLLDTPGWKLRDSRNEPRPRNDLSAALTKQSYIRSAPNRIHARFQVPATTNKLLVSMKQQEHQVARLY